MKRDREKPSNTEKRGREKEEGEKETRIENRNIENS